MKTIIAISVLIGSFLASESAQAGAPASRNPTAAQVIALARANGFKKVSPRVIRAILSAGRKYHVDALELTAIAIIETGLGRYARIRHNPNGTIDRGLFQINTVNFERCIEYNLDSPEGSAFCAAKLLSTIAQRRADYLGAYHSKTPSKKAIYLKKVKRILATNN